MLASGSHGSPTPRASHLVSSCHKNGKSVRQQGETFHLSRLNSEPSLLPHSIGQNKSHSPAQNPKELKSTLSIKWKELQSSITKGEDRKRVKIWGQECNLLWVVSFESLDPVQPESDSPHESN